MSTTSSLRFDNGCAGILGGAFAVCQVQEEEQEEPVETTAIPDQPVEVEPEPDTADPALEDSYILVMDG